MRIQETSHQSRNGFTTIKIRDYSDLKIKIF